MVGTNATRSPRARAAKAQAVISAGARMTRGSPSMSVVALARGGEAAGAHVGRVRRERLAHGLAHLRVAAHEARLPRGLEPEQIVHHHHLPVAVGARADPD